MIQLSKQKQPIFFIPSIIVAILIINSLIYIYNVFTITNFEPQSIFILSIGSFRSAPLDVYNIFSMIFSVFSHYNFEHFILNSLSLIIFATPIARRMTKSRFILYYLLSGVLSIFLFIYLTDVEGYILGASGSISACLGSLVGLGIYRRKRYMPGPRPFDHLRFTLIFVVLWFGIQFLPNIFLATNTQIAWQAHFFGFIIGLIAILFFDQAIIHAKQEIEPQKR